MSWEYHIIIFITYLQERAVKEALIFNRRGEPPKSKLIKLNFYGPDSSIGSSANLGNELWKHIKVTPSSGNERQATSATRREITF